MKKIPKQRVLPLNAQIGNGIKAYTLAWYDYPKSDGLTKKDKAQDKNAEKANKYRVFPSSTNNLFSYHPTFVNYFHAVQNQHMVFWLLKDA